jgi:hypothetical protein
MSTYSRTRQDAESKAREETITTVAGFQAFFERYSRFVDVPERFSAFVNRVRTELPELQDEVRREAVADTPHFNIFRSLGLVQQEAAFHTPFLATLLNPSAPHGQGLLFLESLFAAWKKRGLTTPTGTLAEGTWLVRTEYHLPGFGRLDLLVENATKKYILVIENKIDCNDHDKQLPNYRQWMDTYRRDYSGRDLVYLTPDGRRPKASKGCQCLCLSYRQDIREFLITALQKPMPIPVQAVVRQYLAIVDDIVEDSDEDAGRDEPDRVLDE